MQAVVKTPNIELTIKGAISPKLMSVLEEEFGPALRLDDEDNEAAVNVFETNWQAQINSTMSSGDTLKMYRENHGLTQRQLGDLLEGVPRQHISNMERGLRSISTKTARKLARVFNVSPGKFI